MARLKLTPLEGKILWVLEEAGAENLGCILNTLGVAPSDAGRVPFEFEAAVERLVRLGFVTWSPAVKAEESLAELEYRTAETSWWSSGELCSLSLTEAGERALTE